MEELLNVAIFGELNVEDIENAIIHEIVGEERVVPIRRDIGGRLNVEALSTEECKLLFRFERQHLHRLVHNLRIPAEIVTNNYYRASGVEGLCMYLRRLAYPNRLSDLERLFGVSGPYISVIVTQVMRTIATNKGHLLTNLGSLQWLNENKLREYSHVITEKGGLLENCWGFIDGTARPICRPSINQELYYSGHKRVHCVKYQSLLCPDGIIVNLSGAYPGRRHDAGIFRESGLYDQLQQYTIFNNHRYVIYGDPAYPLSDVVIKPYSIVNITEHQQHFNRSMSAVRQAVEWGFGKLVNEFAFLDFKKNQKLLLQDISNMYKTATILSNCHTCLYGSQSATYFNIEPPTLEAYLGV